VQALPYISRGGICFEDFGVPVLTPALHLQAGVKTAARELAPFAAQLGATRREIAAALQHAYAAQKRFLADLAERGREVLEELDDAENPVVLVGRPYNTCDAGVNLDLPKKLRELGVLAIPMDMLPLDDVRLDERWRTMYWRHGQRLMKAAKFIGATPRLSAIYVTNFGCGPDSFLLRYFGHELGQKPFLQIEIDEHSADAGIMTRCEAFLDTLNGHHGDRRSCGAGVRGEAAEVLPAEGPMLALGGAPCLTAHGRQGGRTLHLPRMSPHAEGLAAAMRAAGIDARVMDEPDEQSLELGKRFTSGRECYPALLTIGDMVRETQRSDFDPRRAAFFMGRANGPCRFGQYYRLHRLVLDELGLRDVPVVTLDQDREFSENLRALTPRFERTAWLAITAFDALTQRLLAVRPYERTPGEAERAFEEAGTELCREIERGGDALACLRRAGRRFDEIAAKPPSSPASRLPLLASSLPLIGIVGEIYIRSNRFSNDQLVRRIEALGGEVALPSAGEWVYYITTIRKRRAVWRRAYGAALRDAVREVVQRRIERRAWRCLALEPESSPEALFRLAKPYVDAAFQGEAILSIGKALEYLLHRGVAGIINVLPFTCMPGTIVTALLKRLKDDYPEIPVLNLSYAGQQSLNTQLRLEAFMHQARERQKRVQ
jgi:predicted nucleotide-binding protein (sugar kinase/HSP70/actin superfamily)